MIRLGLVLAAIVLAVVFAAQNADVVNLSLLGWNLDASLAVIIVLCFAFGALMAALAMLPNIYRLRTEQRKLKQRLAELEPASTATNTTGPSVVDSTADPISSEHVVVPPKSQTPRAQESW
jgi:uncharacterized integral membrane protein